MAHAVCAHCVCVCELLLLLLLPLLLSVRAEWQDDKSDSLLSLSL